MNTVFPDLLLYDNNIIIDCYWVISNKNGCVV